MQSQIIATPKLFIGMDIHKKSWAVHLRTDLFDHKGFSMPPEPEKLDGLLLGWILCSVRRPLSLFNKTKTKFTTKTFLLKRRTNKC